MELNELLTRWGTDEGKPYKGSLIDMGSYAPGNVSCMCAQGQALHLLAGWTPEQLRDAEQAEADLATAKLLNISRAHAVLLRSVNDTQDGAPAIVLTHPERIIGDNARTVLAFWLALDGFTLEQWGAAGDAAWAAAGVAARASNEIQGANLMRDRGQPFYFLPLFGFANPEAIPPLPADYGVPA
jgi:hypothetical protein